MEDKFKLGKKWFWLGIIIAILNPLAGLVFALFLLFEKKFKKESLIILITAVILGILYTLFASWFAAKGYQFSPAGKLESFPVKIEGAPEIGNIIPK